MNLDAGQNPAFNHHPHPPNPLNPPPLAISSVSIIILLFSLLFFVFWIWMLIDCIQNQRIKGTEKIVWVLVIIFLYALGALIYCLAGRKR
jgi:hypothetical protein